MYAYDEKFEQNFCDMILMQNFNISLSLIATGSFQPVTAFRQYVETAT